MVNYGKRSSNPRLHRFEYTIYIPLKNGKIFPYRGEIKAFNQGEVEREIKRKHPGKKYDIVVRGAGVYNGDVIFKMGAF